LVDSKPEKAWSTDTKPFDIARLENHFNKPSLKQETDQESRRQAFDGWPITFWMAASGSG